MKMHYVLDANALLDFIDDCLGATKLQELLLEAIQNKSPLLMSVVNWGEVFYHARREREEEKARQIIASLSQLSIELVNVDAAQAIKAGEIKARNRIPCVDCIAAALPTVRHAVLVYKRSRL